jgi:hypothetical protein
MRQILRSTDPSQFTSSAYWLEMDPMGIATLNKTGDPMSFAEMLKLRKKQTPEEMLKTLQDDQGLLLANVGITVALTVSFRGERYAVFTERPNGQLAHICAYTKADETFYEAACRKVADELLIKKGSAFYSNAYLPLPFADVEHIEYSGIAMVSQSKLLPWWMPTIQHGLWLLPDGVSLDESKSLPECAGLYIDPSSSSAQKVFSAYVELPDADITLQQLDEQLATIDGKPALIAREGELLWLFKLNGSEIDLSEGYHLIDGCLFTLDCEDAIFHPGMVSTNAYGICETESVGIRDIETRIEGSRAWIRQTISYLFEAGHAYIPFELIVRVSESRARDLIPNEPHMLDSAYEDRIAIQNELLQLGVSAELIELIYA